MAHEIRNPLAGIAGVIEIVGRDLPTTSPARGVVKDVRLEIAQINRILTDLLETARPRVPEMRASDLNTTIEHAIMLVRQQVISKPITIDLQKSPDLPEVEHDSDQIHQVLLNLLLNAVQAIEAKGSVSVEIASRDHFAVVTVTDNGRGIPPEILPNIFRPFFTTKGNGTGLGLSLARRIVEEHRGRIEVSSDRQEEQLFECSCPSAPQLLKPALEGDAQISPQGAHVSQEYLLPVVYEPYLTTRLMGDPATIPRRELDQPRNSLVSARLLASLKAFSEARYPRSRYEALIKIIQWLQRMDVRRGHHAELDGLVEYLETNEPARLAFQTASGRCCKTCNL